MVKLAKQYYRLADGTKKINCYHVAISKQMLKDARIDENSKIKITAEKNKIIIERLK